MVCCLQGRSALDCSTKELRHLRADPHAQRRAQVAVGSWHSTGSSGARGRHRSTRTSKFKVALLVEL
eukprot:1132152-Prorocentrum_minimum.AAC.2